MQAQYRASVWPCRVIDVTPCSVLLNVGAKHFLLYTKLFFTLADIITSYCVVSHTIILFEGFVLSYVLSSVSTHKTVRCESLFYETE